MRPLPRDVLAAHRNPRSRGAVVVTGLRVAGEQLGRVAPAAQRATVAEVSAVVCVAVMDDGTRSVDSRWVLASPCWAAVHGASHRLSRFYGIRADRSY